MLLTIAMIFVGITIFGFLAIVLAVLMPLILDKAMENFPVEPVARIGGVALFVGVFGAFACIVIAYLIK